jgi:spore maturation protein CgeB
VSKSWLESVDRFKPELIILQQPANILPEAVAEAKNKKYKIFYWVDSPIAGEQAKDDILSLNFVDKIFSIDRLWQTILFRPEKFVVLPLAGEPSVFKPLAAEKEYDVSFVGSFPPATGDGALRAQILSRIPERYKVAAFGSGLDYWFRYFPNLRKRALGVGIQDDAKLNEIYNRSKIVLSIHSTWHYTSVSARTFEVGLAGAFQLVDWREGYGELFPGGMLEYFHYADEINGLIDDWIKKPEEAARRALETRKYILDNHTWRHRAEKMLSYLK